MTRPRLTTLAFAGILALALPSIASAQDTERELRRENEQLRSQVTDLRAELEALKAENERLRVEIQRLRAALQAGNNSTASSTPPADELPVTIDESKPSASPRANRAAVKASYEATMADDDTGYADSQERRLYLRKVERWQTGALREFRTQIDWLVKVENADNLNQSGLTVVAVDPVSGARLGDPFTIAVPRASLRRLEQLKSRHELDLLSLKGVLQPNLAVNPNLEQPGAFDRTAFLAPFVTYNFSIEVQSLTPPPPAKDDNGGG